MTNMRFDINGDADGGFCPSAFYINALALNDILRFLGKFFGFFFFAVDSNARSNGTLTPA